jgi:hypothetical protein
LIVDNRKQFDNQDFREFYASIGMQAVFMSVYHPLSNRVVERANGKIFTAIKKRLLEDKKGKWAQRLPEAMWALNTTQYCASGFTPFRLAYGIEAMTPHEYNHGSPRTNPKAILDINEPTAKDLLNGDRVKALDTLNKYQATTKAWRDKVVTPKEFEGRTSFSSGLAE